MFSTIKNFLQKFSPPVSEKTAVEAYDIWADSYDVQPGNLMLDLDEIIFSTLIGDIDLKNKKIADIGCGTGRHWQKLYNGNPSLLMGFDVSAGMLNQLSRKFPHAITHHITDNQLNMIPAAFVDCIITTLTVAHIVNIAEAIASWSDIIKKGGDLVITDFHPAMLSQGGKRSFKHKGKSMSVVNYVHGLNDVKTIFENNGFTLVKQEERFIDESVKSYYSMQNAMPVYERFKGLPVIYGLHLKKEHGTE